MSLTVGMSMNAESAKCCQSDQSRMPRSSQARSGERRDHPAAAVGQQPHGRAAVVERRVTPRRPPGVDVAEVVHLEEGLGRHLPVAGDRRAAHGHGLQRVAGQLLELLHRLAVPVAQRGRFRVLVHEDPALPHLAGHPDQVVLVAAEAYEVAVVGDAHQVAASDVVGPPVVLALQVAAPSPWPGARPAPPGAGRSCRTPAPRRRHRARSGSACPGRRT